MIKFKILFELMKPRVMYLSIFTSLVSLISAYSYYNKELNLVHLVLVTIFISLGAGASGVLNMWWDISNE
jgi:protoheme IX farnesyltransferase